MVKWGRLFTRVTMPAPKLSQSQGSDGSNTSAAVFGSFIRVDYHSLNDLFPPSNRLFVARRCLLWMQDTVKKERDLESWSLSR